jgi:hypothetical protein
MKLTETVVVSFADLLACCVLLLRRTDRHKGVSRMVIVQANNALLVCAHLALMGSLTAMRPQQIVAAAAAPHVTMGVDA